MITDGWIDWAARRPGPPIKTNTGLNPVRGIFCHSAEGYVPTLWDILANVSEPLSKRTSWHLSNLLDGTLVQHYPLNTRCWHATAANQSYVGMEHEGYQPNEPTLSAAQIDTTVRVIQELSQHYGWQPTRPVSPTDTSHTLWEHNEVVRIGGTGSSCPSGRIPWPKILAALNPQEGDYMSELIRVNGVANPGYWNGHMLTGIGEEINVRGDFGLPPEAKRALLDVWVTAGGIDVCDGTEGHPFAGAVSTDPFSSPARASVLVILNDTGRAWLRPTAGSALVNLIGIVGYTA